MELTEEKGEKSLKRSLGRCFSRRIPLWLRFLIILAQLKIRRVLGPLGERIPLWDPWAGCRY